jgi:RNA polymerase sigma factor (sigma-70 family)
MCTTSGRGHPAHPLFTRLYQQYHRPVVATCRAQGLSPPDAEDVGADVFVALIKRLHETPAEPLAHPGAWLRRVAVNKSRDFLRKQRRGYTVPLGKVADALAHDDSREDDIRDGAELFAQLESLGVNPEDDELVVLHVEGWTISQIAAIHGLRRESVSRRLARTYARLRERLGAGW